MNVVELQHKTMLLQTSQTSTNLDPKDELHIDPVNPIGDGPGRSRSVDDWDGEE